jgi:3-phenylpropionate/trans-cinnamate dioxygenase ferredoxin component
LGITVPLFHVTLRFTGIAEGTNKAVEIGDRSILMCNDESQIFAIENRCSHAHEPLTCGRIRRGMIACPAHGARFELETSGVLGPPATEPIKTYAIEIIDGMIRIAL